MIPPFAQLGPILDLRSPLDDGWVAVGRDLRPHTLLSAYREGIFPWPPTIDPYTHSNSPLTPWCSPLQRGVLILNERHCPSSLARRARQAPFNYSVDHCFRDVIDACALYPRRHQVPGTWITPELRDAYEVLHRQGVAHSVEVWQESELVGGIYGVDASGVFCAESMFHRRPGASALALFYLLEILEKNGAYWIDIQVISPHLKAWGAREIPRYVFRSWLKETQAQGLRLFPGEYAPFSLTKAPT